MSDPQKQFEELMQRVRDGSEEAARELLDTYGGHIYQAVRRRLNKRLRPKFDSQDFVQAVWLSFFTNRSIITRFTRPESLVAFLARVASNKVVDECRRRFTNQKTNVNREHSMDSAFGPLQFAVAKQEPTPSETMMAAEKWNGMLKGQSNDCRKILEMRAAGNSNREIADKLNLNERTVARIIGRLNRRLV